VSVPLTKAGTILKPPQGIRAIMNLWDNSLDNEIQGALYKDEHLPN
jgi:hypothetical protein